MHFIFLLHIKVIVAIKRSSLICFRSRQSRIQKLLGSRDCLLFCQDHSAWLCAHHTIFRVPHHIGTHFWRNNTTILIYYHLECFGSGAFLFIFHIEVEFPFFQIRKLQIRIILRSQIPHCDLPCLFQADQASIWIIWDAATDKHISAHHLHHRSHHTTWATHDASSHHSTAHHTFRTHP